VPKSKLTTLDAQLSYRAVVAERVSPAFCLAVSSGTKASSAGWASATTSTPGRRVTPARPSRSKVRRLKLPQGTYIRYPSWEEGFRDLAVRLSVPNYIYGRKGLVTIAQIMPVFAPVSDDNNDPIFI
jgi:hypothetical protein